MLMDEIKHRLESLEKRTDALEGKKEKPKPKKIPKQEIHKQAEPKIGISTEESIHSIKESTIDTLEIDPLDKFLRDEKLQEKYGSNWEEVKRQLKK